MEEIETIESRANRRLVAVRRVRDGLDRSLVFIEGARVCREAIASNLQIEDCFFAAGFCDETLVAAARGRAARTACVGDNVFRSITETREPQGIVLTARRPVTDQQLLKTALIRARVPIVVFLYRVSNPSNLGAIVRTAEAAGAAGIITSAGSADVFGAKAVRAAMGSSFRVPIWESAEIETIFGWSVGAGLTATAADISTTLSHSEVDWTVPRLLILGSEAHGLGCDLLDRVSETVKIEIENDTESLNLAVSAGILLFEARRQNQSDLKEPA
jgi:TrmH family RNA methyltransferase